MKVNQLVSIITPVYNVADYLPRCIDSIVNQTYSNFELILIDDGSSDNSLNICKKYACKDKRVIVFHQENKGVSTARNIGINKAKGDLIGFIDADDFIEPDMYETMITILNSTNTEMCVSTKFYFNDSILCNSNIKKQKITKNDAIKGILEMDFPTSLCSCIYKKCLFTKNHLNEDIHYWEDYEFQFRLVNQTNSISICNYPMYHYIQRSNSANHQNFNNKVLTCLKIPEIIISEVEKKNPDLIDLSQKLYKTFLLSVIGYLAKSDRVEKEYFSIITKETRKYLSSNKIIGSKKIKSDIYIFLCSINSKLFYKTYRLIKKQL